MSAGRWTRPDDTDLTRTLNGVARLIVGVVGLLPVCVAASAGYGNRAWIVVGFVVLWEVMMWRALGVGLYVSERGVKVRSVLRTRVLPWASVERAWAGPATGHDAWAIWISTTGPVRDVETPIWRRGSRARRRDRRKLDPVTFAAVLDYLNAEAVRHRDSLAA